MNSTLRSLVFWMVLVVIGALVWHLSTTLQKPATTLTFSDFMDRVVKQEVAEVTIARDEVTGTLKDGEPKTSPCNLKISPSTTFAKKISSPF